LITPPPAPDGRQFSTEVNIPTANPRQVLGAPPCPAACQFLRAPLRGIYRRAPRGRGKLPGALPGSLNYRLPNLTSMTR
jgi:hypothetical protein